MFLSWGMSSGGELLGLESFRLSACSSNGNTGRIGTQAGIQTELEKGGQCQVCIELIGLADFGSD